MTDLELTKQENNQWSQGDLDSEEGLIKDAVLKERKPNNQSLFEEFSEKDNNLKQDKEQSSQHNEIQKQSPSRNQNNKQSNKATRQGSRSRSRDNHKRNKPKYKDYTITKESSYYKTKLCPQFLDKKQCENGSKCNFAHGDHELKQLPNFKKTRICMGYKHNRCPYDSKDCKYAHGRSELTKYKVSRKNQAKKSDTYQTPAYNTSSYLINQNFSQIPYFVPNPNASNFAYNNLDLNFNKFNNNLSPIKYEPILNHNFSNNVCYNYPLIPHYAQPSQRYPGFWEYGNMGSQIHSFQHFDLSLPPGIVYQNPILESNAVNNFQYFQKKVYFQNIPKKNPNV